jgi:hypothetical protein
MLVTPFLLLTPQIRIDRCRPLMTVVVPWAILQASSRPPVEPQISFNSPHHSTNRGLRVTSDSAISLTPLPIMAAAEPALPVRLMVAGRDTAIMGVSDEMGRP